MDFAASSKSIRGGKSTDKRGHHERIKASWSVSLELPKDDFAESGKSMRGGTVLAREGAKSKKYWFTGGHCNVTFPVVFCSKRMST